MLSQRRNLTGPVNMIWGTLQASKGANTLGATGYLHLINKQEAQGP